MAVIVNTSTTTTTCSGPEDVLGKPLVMQGQLFRKSQNAPTTKRVSFNLNCKVYSVKSFRYEDEGTLKDELWYTPMEHMEMQLRINEMIEKLSYVNPAFAEIMYGDTFRGLERILAKRQGLYYEQYDADEHEFVTTQSRDDEDEYQDAAICSRNTWRNSRTCRTVVASVLWSNHYSQTKPSSSEEELRHHHQQQYRSQLQFQILPSMIAGLLVKSDQHDDHQVKKEKNLLQQRVVRKYLLKSMESAKRAIDLAAGDKRFVDEVYSTTARTSTIDRSCRSQQGESSSNGQRMVTTTKKSQSVSSAGTSLVEKLVTLQHVQQQQFAAEAC